MNSYARLIESVRRTRKTLYLVAGLYIAVGFVVATLTAVQGDLMGTFLGFLIISGALSVAIIARTALHVLVRVANIEESLDGFSIRMNELIPPPHENLDSDEDEESAAREEALPVLNLADIGTGHAETLAAATLDRDVYPRLATKVEAAAGDPLVGVITDAPAPTSIAHGNGVHGGNVTIRILLQRWKAALANDDLVECRQILATMVDLTDDEFVSPLSVHLGRLEDRLEHVLRRQFSQSVRSRDFSAAIAIGERICSMLSNRPVAADFERLRPVLVRRAEEASALAPSIR